MFIVSLFNCASNYVTETKFDLWYNKLPNLFGTCVYYICVYFSLYDWSKFIHILWQAKMLQAHHIQDYKMMSAHNAFSTRHY